MSKIGVIIFTFHSVCILEISQMTAWMGLAANWNVFSCNGGCRPVLRSWFCLIAKTP